MYGNEYEWKITNVSINIEIVLCGVRANNNGSHETKKNENGNTNDPIIPI